MTDGIWRAGDKVTLTGKLWGTGAGERLARGKEVTLKQAASPGKWLIEEEFGIYVQTNSDSEWGARKFATGGYVSGSYVPAGIVEVKLSEKDAALIKSIASEVRTTSSTGGEKGVKPEDYQLIPWGAMDEIARVYAFGAQKYAAHNWRKGYEWGKSFSALCRHIFAFWKGEDRDPESGLSHLAHAGFHVLSLLTFWLERERYGEHDDRYHAADPE